MTIFLSTPSARRATDALTDVFSRIKISIHALREEGDLFFLMGGSFLCLISIHALREEGDKQELTHGPVHSIFLSTPSARRATPAFCTKHPAISISIHALREEGDRHIKWGAGGVLLFLSTPSARRAT